MPVALGQSPLLLYILAHPMKTFRPQLLKQLLAGAIALLLAPVAPPLFAESPTSLLPVFGGKGYMLNNVGKDNHTITGWLPKKWCDNSRWAAVNAVYTPLQACSSGQLGASSPRGLRQLAQGCESSSYP